MTQPAQSSYPSWAEYQDTAWQSSVFRALLIALLAASVAAGPVAIFRALAPWRLAYVLPLAFGVALEGVISTARLGKPAWRNRRDLAYRLGEIVALLLVVRLAVWGFSAGWPTLSQMAHWLRTPGDFLDGEFVMIALTLLMTWTLAVNTASDFVQLAIQPDEVAAREGHTWGDSRSAWRLFIPVARGDIMGQFARRWLWGGMLLITLAALSRVSMTTDEARLVKLAISRLGLPREVVVALLVYFLAGLLLLSDARLAVLRGRWFNQRIEIAPSVLRKWHFSSVLMLALVAGLALLLPLGSTGRLGQAVEWLMALAFRIVLALLSLLSLLFWLLSYPLRLLSESGSEAQPVAAPALQIPTQAEVAWHFPDWLGGAVVWATLALMLGYLLFTYLRAQGVLEGRWFARFRALRFWWGARRARIEAFLGPRLAALRVRSRYSRIKRAALVPRASLRPQDLPPREKVRYLYLQALVLAAERGLVRPPHKTPLEFMHDLESNWPDAEEDVQQITAAFVAARYAPREIAPAEIGVVQRIWGRLAQAFRSQVGASSGAPHERGPGERQ